MKLKLGALVAVVVAALLIVPPLLGRVVANTPENEIVLQTDNTHAAVNGEKQTIADENGAALRLVNQDGHLLAPLRWLADTMGLTVTWDASAKATTLTSEKDKKLSVMFAVDAPSMTVGGETVALDVPATLVNGVTYVPLRAIGEACGYQVHALDAAQGGLIFLDNRKKDEEPDEKRVSSALALLGPSRAQILADGLVTRAGSGTLLLRGEQVELTDADGLYRGALAEGGTVYLPVDAAMRGVGGTCRLSDGGATVTNADGEEFALSEGKAGNEASDTFKLYTDEDGVLYASAEAMAHVLGLHAAILDGDAVALTLQDLTGFDDQLAYLAAEGAALPDTKPNIPEAKAYIALTFDDGPTGGKDGLTVQLLDGLKERGAHATFFMCGYRIKDFHTHMDRYLADGHELGNHTMDHPERPILAKMAPDKILEQVDSNSELIASYTGQKPTVMRPVGGAVSDNLKEQMKTLGLPIINWSVDTLDWKYKKDPNDGERIKNLIVSQAKDGDIVLMHDLYKTTVKGVLGAIDELQKEGYAFVTVHELAQIKGIELEPGVVYSGFGDRKGYNG